MPHAAGRRPRRAAAITSKSYKELDTDGSLSELESVLYIFIFHEIIFFFAHSLLSPNI